ncbi:MAG: FHA domain-containing protein, partial [Bacteroidetes bacterium]|nr:FHA domain-containing protein [Bacteroidota bacterium]
MQYIIGRERGQNRIHFPKDSISKSHLGVMLIEDDVIAIEDLGSTNGSFLNGKKIKKSNFSKSDELVLGDIAIKHEWLLKELQQLMKQEKFDFTVEFEELKKMQSDYKEKMKNIKKQSAITGHLFRLGIT